MASKRHEPRSVRLAGNSSQTSSFIQTTEVRRTWLTISRDRVDQKASRPLGSHETKNPVAMSSDKRSTTVRVSVAMTTGCLMKRGRKRPSVATYGAVGRARGRSSGEALHTTGPGFASRLTPDPAVVVECVCVNGLSSIQADMTIKQ